MVEVPHKRFDHVHVDLVGPLPPSNGFSYVFTMVDRFTRYPEAVPVASIDTIEIARAFISQWMARFGVPSDMTSDRGPQFISQLWAGLCKLYGMNLHRTTAYHPQSNGLVERFHRRMKEALTAKLEAAGEDWFDQLPWVMLSHQDDS